VWNVLDGSGDEKTNRIVFLILLFPITGASQDQDSIQSSTFSKLLDQVHKMKKVKAVVLRVDTPGGSVVGSDEIYNQIRRLQAKKIKVVISMGNVAASGGYYISAPADAIFASPATLTGSIGVIMGKFNFEGFLKDLGITLDEGRLFGKNANMLSATTSYTRQQKRKLNQMIDEVYEEFLRKVCAGRAPIYSLLTYVPFSYSIFSIKGPIDDVP
jgi:protease-4